MKVGSMIKLVAWGISGALASGLGWLCHCLEMLLEDVAWPPSRSELSDQLSTRKSLGLLLAITTMFTQEKQTNIYNLSGRDTRQNFHNTREFRRTNPICAYRVASPDIPTASPVSTLTWFKVL